MERKTFPDFFASQRDGRLQSQLSSLEGAAEYLGRLLIVEATDAEWQQDARPADCQDLVGVRTMLKNLQLAYAELNRSGFPAIRILRVRILSRRPKIFSKLALGHIWPR